MHDGPPNQPPEPGSTTLIRGLQPAGGRLRRRGMTIRRGPLRRAPSPRPLRLPLPLAPAAGPAVRRRVRRGRPVRLREPAVRPAAGRPQPGAYRYRHRQPADYRAGQPPAARRRRRGAHHGVVSPAAGGGAHRPDRVPDPVRGAAGHPGPGQRDAVVAGTRPSAGGAGLDRRPPAARFAPAGTGHRVRVVDRHVRAARRAGRADPARAGGAGRPVREPDRDPGGCPGRLAACPSGRRTGPAGRHEC